MIAFSSKKKKVQWNYVEIKRKADYLQLFITTEHICVSSGNFSRVIGHADVIVNLKKAKQNNNNNNNLCRNRRQL